MRKGKEFASLEKTELSNKLNELRKELMKYRAQVAMGTPPKKSSALKELKKSIARIMTVMSKNKGGKNKI